MLDLEILSGDIDHFAALVDPHEVAGAIDRLDVGMVERVLGEAGGGALRVFVVAQRDGGAADAELAVLGVRPEFLPIVQGGPLRGKTYSTLPAGMETTVKLSCGGTMLTSVVFGCVDYAVDTELPLNIVGDNIALFDQASGQSVGFGSVTF